MAVDRNQKQLQSVFKLQCTDRTKADDLTAPDAAPGTAYRPRKSHRKSRLGCKQCRRRHVKCDQTRDQQGCSRCRGFGIECDYLLSQPASARRVVQLQARTFSDASYQPHHRPQSAKYGAQEAESEQTLGQRREYANRAALAIVPSPRSLSFDPISSICADMTPGLVSPLASLHHFEVFT